MASNIPDDGRSCPICFEPYTKPKFLKCGHTFCEMCLNDYIMKSKEKCTLDNGIECPLCRTITAAQCDPSRPDSWAKLLPSNFALEAVMAASENSKECKVTNDRATNAEFSFVCQPCLDEDNHQPASVFCTDCGQFQCVECAKLHKKFSKRHKIIAIDGQEKKIKFLSTIKQIQLCEEHLETKKYLCSSHNQLCCSICVIENHKQCTTMKIEDAAENVPFVTLNESIKVLNVRVKSAAQFWSTRNEDIESQTKPLLKEIKEKREKVNKMFDTLEKKTILYTKTASNERIQEYLSNRKSCEKITASIGETIELCNSAIKYGTPQQKTVLARYLEDKLACYETKSVDEFSKLKSTKVMIIFSPIGEQTNAGEELGKPFLYSEEISVNAIPDCRESSLKLKSYAKLIPTSWYRSIDFLSDGRLVAVDHVSYELLLFDKELNCISKQSLDVPPYSVKTLGSNDEIIVTSGDARLLFYFEVRTDDSLHLVRSMKITVTCDTIAPIDEEAFLVGLFGGTNPVGFVLNNGNVKDIFVDLPKKQYTAENLKCAFNLESEKLAISDKNRDKVFIVDGKNYRIMHSLSESILNPRGVVFGPNDTLFICSGGTNSIVQATIEGRVLMSHKLNVLHPYAICVSQDKRQLAMVNNEINDKQLQVFDIFSANSGTNV